MKSNYTLTACLRRQLGRAVSASALLLLGLTATGQVVPKSPLGTWDCVMSGPRQGLAQITFFDDGTFTNYEIIVLTPQQVSSPNENQRNDGGDTGRGGSTNSTSGGSGVSLPSQIVGGQDTGGPWGFDNRGRVIGYYYEITPPTYTTNTLLLSASTNVSLVPVGEQGITNGSEFCLVQPAGTFTNNGSLNYLYTDACYSNAITASAVTNAISFVGTVVPGKRLTLLASSPAGHVTFRGVAESAMPDLTGSWYGSKLMGQVWYNEFLTLTPSDLGPNAYLVQGDGPGYQYWGMAFFFPQKKFAISLGIYPAFPAPDPSQPAPLLRAMTGPLNVRTFGGTLHGIEGAGNGQNDQFFNFKVQKQ